MTLTLSSPIWKINGITKADAQKVEKLEINNIYDLLTYFPIQYKQIKVAKLKHLKGRNKIAVLLSGIVMSKAKHKPCKNGSIDNYFLFRPYHTVQKIWVNVFTNQPHDINRLQPIVLKGTFNPIYGGIVAYQVVETFGEKIIPPQIDALSNVYRTTKQAPASLIKHLVSLAYKQCQGLIKDEVPFGIRKKYRLQSARWTDYNLQFPKNEQSVQIARRTAKFNEAYHFQVHLQQLKAHRHLNKGIAIKFKPKILKNLRDRIPFTLTHSQKRSVNQLIIDLSRPYQTKRLLQGDVGSGKTIVAVFGILAVISAGYQVTIMVPTSVLAKQHYRNIKHALAKFHVNVGLLISGMKTRKRQWTLNRIYDGTFNLIIGTEALFQKDVFYHKLGFVIIDEQHLFGVKQRQALKNKGKGVNILSMTATPIPRTFAITLYGDMDSSKITEMPKGRRVIRTKWLNTNRVSKCYSLINKVIKKKQQIFIVAPLIKQSSKRKSHERSAVNVYQNLNKNTHYKVGLLDGQMSDSKKSKVIKAFKAHKYQLLVSTTVIEVGIDIADASLMIILNADHYGLAQLHQLRGRVGRSSNQAYCLLLAKSPSKTGVKRMHAMEKYHDGFKLSAIDLKMRGSGDIFGNIQSGMPNFKILQPFNSPTDEEIMSVAQIEASNVVNHRQNNKHYI